MHTFKLIAEPFGLTLGSLLVGLMVPIGLWAAFRHFRHGTLGLFLTAFLAPLPFLTHSLFLDMTVVFAVVSASALWFAELEGGRHGG